VPGGRVETGEKDVTWVPPKDREIAMVFQNYALYPSETVAENTGFALKMQHVPKAERDRRVREAAKLLDLDDGPRDASLRPRGRTSPSASSRMTSSRSTR
jgi:ABC-type sugar transport system ATPase subunit